MILDVEEENKLIKSNIWQQRGDLSPWLSNKQRIIIIARSGIQFLISNHMDPFSGVSPLNY